MVQTRRAQQMSHRQALRSPSIDSHRPRNDGEGHNILARMRRSADKMKMFLQLARQVAIDDQKDLGTVESSGADVCGVEERHCAGSESDKQGQALFLNETGVQGDVEHVELGEGVREVLC